MVDMAKARTSFLKTLLRFEKGTQAYILSVLVGPVLLLWHCLPSISVSLVPQGYG